VDVLLDKEDDIDSNPPIYR